MDGQPVPYPDMKQNHSSKILDITLSHNEYLYPRRKICYRGNSITITYFIHKQCSNCGKRTERTEMHHMQYHDDDPLRDTIELCVQCHRKIPKSEIPVKKKMLKGRKKGEMKVNNKRIKKDIDRLLKELGLN